MARIKHTVIDLLTGEANTGTKQCIATLLNMSVQRFTDLIKKKVIIIDHYAISFNTTIHKERRKWDQLRPTKIPKTKTS